MELNKPNIAEVSHPDYGSFEVYYSMRPTDFFTLVNFWKKEKTEFTAYNLSRWLAVSLINGHLDEIMPDTDMKYWYILPVDGLYYLMPFRRT